MQKNKLHTAINIIGLALAFTCSILLYLMVYNEFSFDDYHANKTKLFKLYRYANSPVGLNVSSSMAYPAANALKAENIGIEKITRIKNRGKGIRYKEKSLEQSVQLVDDDFFSMFSFQVVNGMKRHQLANIGDVVLSEKTAINLFGKENPIGKTIEVKIGGKWNDLVVSSILQEAPLNSSITYSVLARTELDPDYLAFKDDWNHTHHDIYIQLSLNVNENSLEKRLLSFTKKYQTEDSAYLINKGFIKDENGSYAGYKILPIKDLHFNSKLGSGNAISKQYLYILSIIGFVIVLIACFNFINLNIGLSFTRTREIGIRKCLGAAKSQIWMQVWGESLITVLVALLIAIACTIILMNGFNTLMQTKFAITLLYSPLPIFCLIILLLLVSLLASGYPSYIMGKLKTVEILKGKISLKKPGLFRNSLIITQFVIAIVLICCTTIIYQQFQHLRNAPLGYTTETLVSIPIKQYEKGNNIVDKMRTLLSSNTSIISVSGSDVNMGLGEDGSTSQTGYGFDYNGKSINTNYMSASYDILKTLNIPLKKGRDFTAAYVADSANSIIITESMAKQLGEKDILGLTFYSDSSRPKWTVVGVIPDFNLYSMYEKSEPLTISLNNQSFISYVLIRVNTQNPMATLRLIKSTYAQVEPGVEFKGSYVKENIDRWYANEKRLSTMFSIASVVAIILSCMGLFGMAFIIIRQRVKEIGVRKVLGSSVNGIAVLVTKEFIKPVVIALIIATPIAWWAMQKWLQDFAYRINVEWWVFALAGIIAVLISILTVSFHSVKAAIANPIKSLRTE